jgi:hypothetical protein
VWTCTAKGPIFHSPDDIWMNMEQRWNGIDRGKSKHFGKNLPQFTTNSTWTDLGFRSEKPATDCLMYETAFLILYLRVWQNANPVVHGASIRLVTHWPLLCRHRVSTPWSRPLFLNERVHTRHRHRIGRAAVSFECPVSPLTRHTGSGVNVADRCFKLTRSHESLFSRHLASIWSSLTWTQWVPKISFLKLKTNRLCGTLLVKSTVTKIISTMLGKKLYQNMIYFSKTKRHAVHAFPSSGIKKGPRCYETWHQNWFDKYF